MKTEDDEILSERIHDSDPEVNERLVHWLHSFFLGEKTIDELRATFHEAYPLKPGSGVVPSYPWE